LARNDSLCDGGIEHLLDDSETVLSFETASLIPPEHGRAIDQQDWLYAGVFSRGVEELLQCGCKEFECVAAFTHDGGRGQVRLHLIKHSAKEVLLVRKVVVKGTARADVCFGDDLFRWGGEVALADEQLPGGADQGSL